MVFNPLGESLSILWDLIAIFLSLVFVMLVVQINAVIQKSGKLDQVITRKLVHIFAAPVYIVSWMLYSGTIFSRFLTMIVPILFILMFYAVGTGKMKNENLVASMSRTGDPKELLGGTLHYAIIMVVISILWFYAFGTIRNPTALIIIGCLAGGDGLADVVGRKYGGDRKFGIRGSQKTVIGSLGMFVGSFLTSVILILIFSLENPTFNIITLIVPILVVSLVATIVEALSPPGYDNWLVVISVIIMITIFTFLLPNWWPFSYITFF